MTDPNADQRDFCTDQAGPTWVARMGPMDAALQPVLDALLNRADLQPGQHVLDIGCGGGTSTLAISDRVGPSGRVTGVDISERLLGVAKSLIHLTTHGCNFAAVLCHLQVFFSLVCTIKFTKCSIFPINF